MGQKFTRAELHGLVWVEPMRFLAKKYNISDRGLAKACLHADIPVPERGYWNKLQAGHKVTRRPLPPRGIGKSDEVMIGDHSYLTDEEALVMIIPQPPEFPETIESVMARVRTITSHIKIQKNLSKQHPLISRLYGEDERRHQKNMGYGFNMDTPIFDAVFEHRRLKILNSIFMAVEQYGMRAAVNGKEARGLTIIVGDQQVSFTLDSSKANKHLERERQGYGFTARGNDDPMILKLSPEKVWQDTGAVKIEEHIREIVEEIIVAGEVQCRSGALRHYEWLLERKAGAEKRELECQKEIERKHREHIRRLERQRIEDLLGQASALRQANDIREYVKSAQQISADLDGAVPSAEMQEWAGWVLEQADRIDPVKSGAFRKRRIELDKGSENSQA
jgi:hypothetical protein